MNQRVRIDFAELDALAGVDGFVSVLERDKQTGIVRYASVSLDRMEEGSLVRIDASYVLGFPNRGRRLYRLLEMDMRVQDDAFEVVSARRLGRLVPSALLVEPLMMLARLLARGRLPARAYQDVLARTGSECLPWAAGPTRQGGIRHVSLTAGEALQAHGGKGKAEERRRADARRQRSARLRRRRERWS